MDTLEPHPEGGVPSALKDLHLHDPLSFSAAASAAGQIWIRDLPDLIASTCHRWHLDADEGGARAGYQGIAVPVRRRRDRYVVKLAWPPQRIVDEVRALSVWDGRGAVQVIASDTDSGAIPRGPALIRQTGIGCRMTPHASMART